MSDLSLDELVADLRKRVEALEAVLLPPKFNAPKPSPPKAEKKAK